MAGAFFWVHALLFNMSLRLVSTTLSVAATIALGCSTFHTTAVGSARTVAGESRRVVIDGSFDDWTAEATLARVPGDAAEGGGWPAVASVAAREDGHYIYLKIDLARASSLYGLRGGISLQFDADANTATGAEVDRLPGVDFTVELSPSVNGRATEGAALRVLSKNGAEQRADAYAADFVMLPSYATTIAELRIARGRRLDSTAATIFAGASYRAQVVVRDSNGVTRYQLPPFTATLSPLDTTRAVTSQDPLARAPNTQFRALVWNVANEGIRDRPERFRRILDAVDPDLLVLDEVGGVIGHEGMGKFLASIDSGRSVARGGWQYTYGGGGGYQRTVIAARSTVAELPEFRFIPFPDSIAARLLDAVPAVVRERQRASLADGVATGAALVTLNGKRVAVVGVDLQSAGNASGSWQEQRRQAEARIIRDATVAAVRAHGAVDAIIAAGDHNLVATRQPLSTLGEIGQLLLGKPLAVASLLQLDSATAATWDGGSGPFPPGRLDWFSYTDASLEVVGGFVFDAADLDPHWRAAHHLDVDDSKKSSDHRSVVVDLRWR